MTDSTAVAVAAPPSSNPISVFQSESSFVSAQRMAQALVTSDLVPEAYRGKDKIGNALIAMDMANRMGLSPMVVMQNLHIISGRPSWASSFIISALNSSGLFSPLRFKVEDLGEREVSFNSWEGPKGQRTRVTKKMKLHDRRFVAYAIEKATGEVLEGPEVSYGMAVAEGWWTKPDSKWLTMPDLMGRYRAAAFFGRLYAPDILNGMRTDEEVLDVEYSVLERDTHASPESAALMADNKPEGRARGLHAAMGNKPADDGMQQAPEEKPAEKKPAGRKPAAAKKAEPVQEPETEEDDSVDASGMVDEDTGGEDGPDIFGPDDGDDDFNPA